MTFFQVLKLKQVLGKCAGCFLQNILQKTSIRLITSYKKTIYGFVYCLYPCFIIMTS